MPPEMTPEQALAKPQEIKAIIEETNCISHVTAMIKLLSWLMNERIEQLKAIANQK